MKKKPETRAELLKQRNAGRRLMRKALKTIGAAQQIARDAQKQTEDTQNTLTQTLAIVRDWERINSQKDVRIAELEMEIKNWQFDELVRMALRDTKPASNAVQ